MNMQITDHGILDRIGEQKHASLDFPVELNENADHDFGEADGYSKIARRVSGTSE